MPLTSAASDAHHVHLVLNGEPILLESNQNHATIQTDGICTTLSASMGLGGGYVPMITDRAFSENGFSKYTETDGDLTSLRASGGSNGGVQKP